MLYLLYFEDVDDNVAIRARWLDEHMGHIGGYADRIRLGGPLMRADRATQAGGMGLLEAESEAGVRTMLEADPYYRAGLWRTVRTHPVREIINAWR